MGSSVFLILWFLQVFSKSYIFNVNYMSRPSEFYLTLS